MPSTVRPTSAQKSNQPLAAKKKFRTVLGLSQIPKETNLTDHSASTIRHHQTFARRSIDTARHYSQRRTRRADRASVADIDFFERDLVVLEDPITPDNDTPNAVVDLTTDITDMPSVSDNAPAHQSSRRPPVRMDHQDGPWSVSVAESPHHNHSYSLYIKTPTHNLTLTRTAMEVVELDNKLRESNPGLIIPKLPIDATALPAATPKRKSTFLNTLSRLASPTSGKSGRNLSSSRRSNNASTAPSALPTPASEGSDPFLSFSPSNVNASLPAPSPNSSAVAAYLTTISNTPSLRQARVWKRFVRVRTDDLESVRVERAIKRVRSDLAAHLGMAGTPKGDKENSFKAASTTATEGGGENGSIDEKHSGHDTPQAANVPLPSESLDGELNEDDGDVATLDGVDTSSLGTAEASPPANQPSPAPQPPSQQQTLASTSAEDDEPKTPSASEGPSAAGRLLRSHSADPDKSSRLSRAFTESVSNQDGMSSQTETGDESSISTSANRRSRKKRVGSSQQKKSQRKVVIDDFEMMRVLGKGCAGKVLLVKQKTTSELYALKAITKRHVLAHQELQHTLTEQAVLKRMAAESKDPFVVKLWWSFHDKENLFLVMDFHPGGDLATQLARWGRLGRDRARFYAAEIVEGCEGLHAAGVIYRDLKPENILIGADGHIVLTDFGLSKEFPRRTAAITAPSTPSGSRGEFYSSTSGPTGPLQPATPPWQKVDKGGELASGWPGQPVGHSDSTSTFCGTAEYLAPEVIQGLPYSYEIDWWSFGTMLFEMLTGITPFWANNHSDMYVRVLQDELTFPDDRAIDQDTKSLIRGLLQRNPALRICEPRIKRHPYFSMIDWSHVYYKRYIPPYIPPIDPSNASDTQNFDDTFLDMEPVLDDANENEQTDTDQEQDHTDTDRTDGEESNTTPSQSRSSSMRPQPVTQGEGDDSVDVFDGYSFKGRHSMVLDDDEDEESEEETDEEEGGDILSALEPETPKAIDIEEEDVAEPKTPEARPMVLPLDTTPEAVSEPPSQVISVEREPIPAPAAETKPRKSKEQTPQASPVEVIPTTIPEKEAKVKHAPPSRVTRPTRPRKEKSGVQALDRYLSDAVDEDAEATERDDDEDDDWDFVEAGDGLGEDRNGAKGTSLFARGVVDRYRLAVFRKASTPSQRSAPRSFSGMSKESEVSDAGDSPSPSQRRGRNPGLTFRKHPRQFLRPKSPPSTYSSKSSAVSKSLSNSATLSAASGTSSGGLLTPSPSMGSTNAGSPSLKSKESALSVGAQSSASDQSANGEASEAPGPSEPTKGSSPEEPEKQKNKKLKKYKENAEKVFSLFSGSSPRQQT